VHHYPRMHGRSQFFRVRSLAVTLTQLVKLWMRLVLVPAVWSVKPAEAPSPRLSAK